jgi:hypothetical protein
MHETNAAEAIPPRIWVMMRSAPRTQGRAPIRHMPKVTYAELESAKPSFRNTTALMGVREKTYGGIE